MRLNVLITAASRRVGLVRGFQQALHRPGLAGEVHGLRRQPGLAGGAPRRPRLRGAVLRRSRTTSTPSTPSACATRSAWSCRPSTTRSRASRAVRDRFDAIGDARRGVAARHRARVQRQVGDVPPAGGGGRRRGDDVAAATSCPPSPPLPALRQAALGRGAACRRSRRATRSSWRSSSATSSTPVVQEYLDGPEFTLDLLCDFEGRPLSVVPRERVVIRAGRHRPRPDGPATRG